MPQSSPETLSSPKAESSPETQSSPKPQSSAGRKRILAEPEKRRTLCTLVAAGAGLEAAAKHVGCSVYTVRREAQRDEQFAEQLRHSETSATLTPLQAVRSAASSHWRAAAWLLERTHPEQFARRKIQEVAPAKVTSLFADIATIVSEECEKPELRKQLDQRFRELQQESFGPEPQRLPPERDEADILCDQLAREQRDSADTLIRNLRFSTSAERKRDRAPALERSPAPSPPADKPPSSRGPTRTEVARRVREFCERKFNEQSAPKTANNTSSKQPNENAA